MIDARILPGCWRAALRGAQHVAVAAALISIPAGHAVAAGNAERGKALYGVCSTCHGPNGEGMREMNAPALAGREDWYLIRQLQNFRSGARGGNPADVFGAQMAPMAKILADEQAIEDVAAFLSSLGN